MPESHYDTLGINKQATQTEIKRAYRQLSLKYHPDKNQDKGAPAIFQTINEAYEVLSDESKRREYDAISSNPFMQRSGSMHGHTEVNIDDLFQNIFGFQSGNGMDSFPATSMGGGGGFPFGNVHVFHNGVPLQQRVSKPPAITQTITINMEQVYNGATIPVEIDRWTMENGYRTAEKETIYVEIPQGVDDNEIIVLKDRGNIMNDNQRGDVKIFVKINNLTDFKRNGLDLIIEKQVTLKEALCGFVFEVKHINGKNYSINNNQGSIVTPSYYKAIPNMGLTRNGRTGNLVITFDVSFPEKLTDEQIVRLKDVLV